MRFEPYLDSTPMNPKLPLHQVDAFFAKAAGCTPSPAGMVSYLNEIDSSMR